MEEAKRGHKGITRRRASEATSAERRINEYRQLTSTYTRSILRTLSSALTSLQNDNETEKGNGAENDDGRSGEQDVTFPPIPSRVVNFPLRLTPLPPLPDTLPTVSAIAISAGGASAVRTSVSPAEGGAAERRSDAASAQEFSSEASSLGIEDLDGWVRWLERIIGKKAGVRVTPDSASGRLLLGARYAIMHGVNLRYTLPVLAGDDENVFERLLRLWAQGDTEGEGEESGVILRTESEPPQNLLSFILENDDADLLEKLWKKLSPAFVWMDVTTTFSRTTMMDETANGTTTNKTGDGTRDEGSNGDKNSNASFLAFILPKMKSPLTETDDEERWLAELVASYVEWAEAAERTGRIRGTVGWRVVPPSPFSNAPTSEERPDEDEMEGGEWNIIEAVDMREFVITALAAKITRLRILSPSAQPEYALPLFAPDSNESYYHLLVPVLFFAREDGGLRAYVLEPDETCELCKEISPAALRNDGKCGEVEGGGQVLCQRMTPSVLRRRGGIRLRPVPVPESDPYYYIHTLDWARHWYKEQRQKELGRLNEAARAWLFAPVIALVAAQDSELNGHLASALERARVVTTDLSDTTRHLSKQVDIARLGYAHAATMEAMQGLSRNSFGGVLQAEGWFAEFVIRSLVEIGLLLGATEAFTDSPAYSDLIARIEAAVENIRRMIDDALCVLEVAGPGREVRAMMTMTLAQEYEVITARRALFLARQLTPIYAFYISGIPETFVMETNKVTDAAQLGLYALHLANTEALLIVRDILEGVADTDAGKGDDRKAEVDEDEIKSEITRLLPAVYEAARALDRRYDFPDIPLVTG